VGAPDADQLLGPKISPDGSRVAAHRTVQGNMDVWLLDAMRTTRFTFSAGQDRFPVWSPDGNRIVFDSNRNGHRDLYVKAANGATNEELLIESDQNKVASDWSRDGRFLLYLSDDPQTEYDLWVLPMEGNQKPFVFLKTAFDERRGVFSPDGRWVAYMSNESGRYEVYVRAFTGTSSPSASGQWQVSTFGGMTPHWNPDGKELYYVAPGGKIMAAPIMVDGTTVRPGAPVPLFQSRIVGNGTDISVGREYDVSADGRFLINTTLEEPHSPITLLQN